jgi:hypothetical protein
LATRLYLAAGTTPSGGITPAFAAWGGTASAVRRQLVLPTDPGADALATGASVASAVAGQSTLHRQYISEPLAAGIAFVSGTSTFSCQIQGLESAINDNIINRVRAVKVVSQDGATLRATLIALGNATSVVEWAVVLTNLTFLNATAAGASYTTVAGDRLVLEVGHNDSAGASIAGQMRFGVTGQTGDLGVNETDTTTTLRPWFESSVNLTFLTDPRTWRNVRVVGQAVGRAVTRMVADDRHLERRGSVLIPRLWTPEEVLS